MNGVSGGFDVVETSVGGSSVSYAVVIGTNVDGVSATEGGASVLTASVGTEDDVAGTTVVDVSGSSDAVETSMDGVSCSFDVVETSVGGSSVSCDCEETSVGGISVSYAVVIGTNVDGVSATEGGASVLTAPVGTEDNVAGTTVVDVSGSSDAVAIGTKVDGVSVSSNVVETSVDVLSVSCLAVETGKDGVSGSSDVVETSVSYPVMGIGVDASSCSSDVVGTSVDRLCVSYVVMATGVVGASSSSDVVETSVDGAVVMSLMSSSGNLLVFSTMTDVSVLSIIRSAAKTCMRSQPVTFSISKAIASLYMLFLKKNEISLIRKNKFSSSSF